MRLRTSALGKDSLVTRGSAMMSPTRMRGLRGGEGILEYRLHGFPVVPAARRVQVVQVLALEADAPAGGLFQPSTSLEVVVLRSPIPPPAQRLPGEDSEGDVVHRAHHARAPAEEAALTGKSC